MDAEWYCVYGVVFTTRIVAEGGTIGGLLGELQAVGSGTILNSAYMVNKR